MGNLAQMSGQNNHFAHYASVEKLPYAMDRYRTK